MSCEAPTQSARGVTSAPGDIRETLTRHHGDTWAWALICCRGDRQAAHDVLHDVYVGVLSGRATFNARSKFKTWLFGVVRVTAMATRRRRIFLDFLFEPMDRHAERISAPEAPDIASPRLRAAIAALPARQREVVALVFAHDLTIEEAASVMKVSVGTARQHHARAKEKLRAALSINQATEHE